MINDTLLLPISDAKIKVAVFQLCGDKTLGPDGFFGLLYQQN